MTSATMPSRLELLDAPVRVPIAVRLWTLQILVRNLVGVDPCIEVVVPLRGEVGPVAA